MQVFNFYRRRGPGITPAAARRPLFAYTAPNVNPLPLPPTPPRSGYDQQLLAAARTRLANERTLLTYVRTSLALTGFGLALLQLAPHRSQLLGIGALATAGVMLLIGYLRFRYHGRQIEECRTA